MDERRPASRSGARRSQPLSTLGQPDKVLATVIAQHDDILTEVAAGDGAARRRHGTEHSLGFSSAHGAGVHR